MNPIRLTGYRRSIQSSGSKLMEVVHVPVNDMKQITRRIAELEEQRDRLREQIRTLNEDLASEFGYPPSTNDEIESGGYLQKGDMTSA